MSAAATARRRSRSSATPAPPIPDTIAATGLDEPFLLDLTLKHVYFGSGQQAIELSRAMALDFHLVNGLLETLEKRHVVTRDGGSGALGGVWMRWSITRAGREKVGEILARDNYRGPAPVPVEQYVAQLRQQRLGRNPVTPERVERAFSTLVLDRKIVRHIGPAVCSGRPIFLYGPPGNGKTAIGECIAAALSGEVYVPWALRSGGEIAVVYDQVHHRAVDCEPGEHDPRWVRCRRPAVMVGGELTLDMLDLASAPQATFSKAPFQVKANSGVLVIDDFGRQRCEPRELLNRWIVPLESRFDILSFPSGQKMKLPFDCLVVFSTNLDPRALADDAFLRRIRYKIRVGEPNLSQYREIFRRQCAALEIPYDPSAVNYLIRQHYLAARRPFRACEPRDLLQQMRDIHRYEGAMPALTPMAIDRLAEIYFGGLDGEPEPFSDQDTAC